MKNFIVEANPTTGNAYLQMYEIETTKKFKILMSSVPLKLMQNPNFTNTKLKEIQEILQFLDSPQGKTTLKIFSYVTTRFGGCQYPQDFNPK